MDTSLALALGIVIGLVVGAVGGVILARSRRGADADTVAGENPEVTAARHEAELARVREEDAASRAELEQRLTAERAELSQQLAGATATLAATQENLRAQKQQYDDVLAQQRAENKERAERDREQNSVLQALAPVRESLQHMTKTVTELEQQRTRQHGELAQQLRTAAGSEERLRQTADSLAAALKSNSTRGVWGETQLRRVVEAAGMIERVDFDEQSTISSDAGAGRPDMVVHLPGGKSIAVDAKAPLAAYLEASAIPPSSDEAETARREELMDQHVKALRSHVTALGAKSYWDGLDASPEFVIAFIPSESLVSAAMQTDPEIMEFAFGKRVALASPVTLWSVLKSVAYTWQQEVLTEDAKRLFDLSREIYGRMATMTSHISKLGRSLTSSVADYNKFVGSLERQVLPSGRKLAALDESKVIARLDGVEETARELTAPELTAGDGAAPDDAAPEGAAPEGAAPELTAGDAAAPDDAAPDGAASELAAGGQTGDGAIGSDHA